ncbi:MAG: universal stress protein [Solirubrobacteraceae bacterium]
MASLTPRPSIVVGYDGSDASRAALLFAARQAGSGGRVFVVHAFELPPDLLGSPNYEAILSQRRDRGEALLKALPLEEEPLAGPAYELELIGGPAPEVIERVARIRNVDEIVVGARGLGRMRALLGSVSHELLHIADRPVVVIPTAAVEPDVQSSVTADRARED